MDFDARADGIVFKVSFNPKYACSCIAFGDAISKLHHDIPSELSITPTKYISARRRWFTLSLMYKDIKFSVVIDRFWDISL